MPQLEQERSQVTTGACGEYADEVLVPVLAELLVLQELRPAGSTDRGRDGDEDGPVATRHALARAELKRRANSPEYIWAHHLRMLQRAQRDVAADQAVVSYWEKRKRQVSSIKSLRERRVAAARLAKELESDDEDDDESVEDKGEGEFEDTSDEEVETAIGALFNEHQRLAGRKALTLGGEGTGQW